MWDLVSLKCTNWHVKCNLCASSAVLALDQHFAHARARAPELGRANACARSRAFTQKAALKMRAA